MRRIIKQSFPHLKIRHKECHHWYIPHTAGQLTLTLYPSYTCTSQYWEGYTSYILESGETRKLNNESDYTAWREELDNNEDTVDTDIYVDSFNGNTIKWRLPDGTIIEGNSINVEVPEGETLCICPDFNACYLDVQCDILLTKYEDFPRFCGFHLRSANRVKHILDLRRDNYSHLDKINLQPFHRPNGFSFVGSETSPNGIRGTTKDLNYLIDPHCNGLTRLILNYCPHITGNIHEITKGYYPTFNRFKVDIGTGEREYYPYYLRGQEGEIIEGSADKFKISYHHTMVTGYPAFAFCYEIRDWEFYACPNVTADDYDTFVKSLTMSGDGYRISSSCNITGFVTPNDNDNGWVAATAGTFCRNVHYCKTAGKEPIPAFGTLKISNRTNDATARAEYIALLREAGWVVEEIDDSLETGIYATNEV